MARHGNLALLSAVGYQDRENQVRMRTDTIFQIMSMAKPITSVGIVMLMEEGRLAVTDPVEKYLPEFRGQMLEEGCSADGNGTIAACRSPPAPSPFAIF
jgi:CubicO group peptidase (beta-lactamase class C family)